MLKTCTKCRQAKPRTEFHKESGQGSGLRPMCKVCRREDQLRKKAAFKEMITPLKSEHPCLDCGLRYPTVCMDFDHVRGTKLNDISRMRLSGLAKVEAEIAKCELVCSNCHRIRTYNRRPDTKTPVPSLKGQVFGVPR